MTNVCIVATIVVYLAAMLAVGFAYSKSNEDSTDFYLGGRTMSQLSQVPTARPMAVQPGEAMPVR